MKKERFLFLILFSFVFVCALVNALSDIQIVACEVAHSNNTCDKLEGLDLVTVEECCSSLGKCCKYVVSLADFKSALIKAIKGYFSKSPVLSTAEIKDMVYAYFTAKGNTVNLDVMGKYSGKKLLYTYNKVKGCVPASCSSLGKKCGSWNDECGGTLNCSSCAAGKTCSNGQCIGCQDGACNLGNSNLCVPLVKNGNPKIKVDIIFIPDDYMNNQELFSNDILSFKSRVSKFVDSESGLFSKEPFRSNRDLFNVHILNLTENKDCQIPDENGGNTGGCKLWAEEKAKNCGTFDSIVVLSDDLKGTGGQAGYAFTGMNFAQISPFSISREEALKHPELYIDPWVRTFVHEFGHSFGGAKDEYYTYDIFTDPSQYPNCDSFGCPKWCSGIPTLPKPQYEECSKINNKQECENSNFKPPCFWTRIYGKDVCSGTFSEQNFGVNCLSGYGCYQGCEGLNGYRSMLGCNIMGGKCTGNEDWKYLEFSPRAKQIIKQLIDNIISKNK